MKVIVNEKPKSFFLAMKDIDGNHRWRKVIGHEIIVGKYRFAASGLPEEDGSVINISEVSTGLKVFEISYLDPIVYLSTETKEGTIQFYRNIIAERLKKIISLPNFEKSLEKGRMDIKQKFGDMPQSEEYDDSFLTHPISENLN